ncbi:MAG: hypothetical protein R6U70_10545 [Bacillota bacterium]
MFRPVLLTLVVLLVVASSCARGPGMRVWRGPEPGPDSDLPRLLWRMEFTSEDVRMARRPGGRTLMLYWTDGEGGELALVDLTGEVIGRKTVPGVLLEGGFRLEGGTAQVLYQDVGGVVVTFGVTSTGEVVSFEFEEPYPWDSLALLRRGPLEVIGRDDRWIYLTELGETPRGWILATTITGLVRDH